MEEALSAFGMGEITRTPITAPCVSNVIPPSCKQERTSACGPGRHDALRQTAASNDGRLRLISLLVIVSAFTALSLTTDSSTANAMTGSAALDVLAGEISIRDTYEDRYCNRVVGRADCSDEPIERWVLMVWLVRSVSDEVPVLEEASRFTDVNSDHEWWAAHVELAAELGITKGCGSGSFCPYSPVTRAQMARFFSRAFGLDPGDPAGFEDTVGRAYAKAVDSGVAAGVVGGCSGNPRRYCPRDEVTFGQMALYLARVLDLLPRLEPMTGEPGDYYLTFDTSSGYRVTNISGTDLRVLGGDPLSVSVAPDGAAIVFDKYTSTGRVSRLADGPVPAIWSMDANGADRVRLTKYGRDPVWSPNGASITFALEHRGTETGIWVMNPDGSDQRRLQAGGRSPSWSPDGSKIAYYGPPLYDHVRGGRWASVHVMDSDGANQRQLTDRIRDDYAGRLHWSPDGNTIAYRRHNAGNPRARKWELWVVKADGTGNRRIAYGQDLSWSPDGTKIAYSTWPELWVMNASRTGKRTLASDGVYPAWSPDGTTLAYTVTNYTRARGVTSFNNTDFEVWLMDTDGSNRRKLADGHKPIWIPAQQAREEEPDSETVSSNGRQVVASSTPRNQPSTARSG